jgi:hypothetical protein
MFSTKENKENVNYSCGIGEVLEDLTLTLYEV